MQRLAQELLSALERRGDLEVTQLLLRTSWRATHLRTPMFMASLLWRIPRLVRARGTDLILFSSVVTASTAILLRRLLPNPPAMAAVAHGLDVTMPVALYQRLIPRVFGALDGVLAISRAAGDACVERGLDPARLLVPGVGVLDGSAPLPAEDRAGASGSLQEGRGARESFEDRRGARQSLRDQSVARDSLLSWLRSRARLVPSDGFLLLSVGRHVERKGFHWFARQVMPLLPADTHYLLTGKGPMTPAIQRAIGAAGLEGRVHLLDRVTQEELSRLYLGADLFVMPNLPVAGDMEGFGLVLVEAALSGLPAVAADLEGIRDVVSPGVNGTLVESGNAGAFVEAIASYRAAQVRREAGARAREFALKQFNWDLVGERYAQALRQLGRGRRAT